MAGKLTLCEGRNTELSLSFMVVSKDTQESTKLVNALLAQQGQQHWQHQLFAHSCLSLEEVVLCSNIKINVDYCIFLMMSHKENLEEEINENLKYLDQTFFHCRFCFVLVQNGPYQATITNVGYLRETFKCHVFVVDQDKWLTLAGRVMNLAIAACGFKTGMSPYVNLM